MSNITPIRTEAETALLTLFDAQRASLPGAPEVRKAAIERFARSGLPHRRIESWHYTDLRSAMRTVLPPAPNGAASITAVPRTDLTSGVRFVVVDGAFRPDLSDLATLPPGVQVRSLADEARANPQSTALAQFTGEDDPAIALNTALASDGVVIDVAPDVAVAEPLVLCTFSSGANASATRSLLRVGAGASVTLVEDCSTADGAVAQRNDCLVVTVGAKAQVRHVARVAQPGAASVHLHSLVLTQMEGSRFDSFCLVADGGLVRRQIFAGMVGQHATLGLSGLSLLDAARLADTTLVVDHAVPHGTSREFFRFILAGESTGVYQGKVVVRPHAQKTDGGMRSNALVLSDGATMNNKPELEIFADDVVCGHGATVGQLDDDQLFYLMARGVPRAEAEGLLIEAFGAQVIDGVADERLRDALQDDLRAWLRARSEAARR